jgi:hypothetical protein
LRVKPGVSAVYGSDGRPIPIEADGTMLVRVEESAALKAAGHLELKPDRGR